MCTSSFFSLIRPRSLFIHFRYRMHLWDRWLLNININTTLLVLTIVVSSTSHPYSCLPAPTPPSSPSRSSSTLAVIFLLFIEAEPALLAFFVYGITLGQACCCCCFFPISWIPYSTCFAYVTSKGSRQQTEPAEGEGTTSATTNAYWQCWRRWHPRLF